MADLVVGGLASILVGAAFEGFLLANIVNQIFILYAYLAIAPFLLDCATINASEPSGEAPPQELAYQEHLVYS